MRLFASSTPSLYHATHTVSLRTHANTLIPLSEFAAPLIPPFYSNPLLFNGHLQTFWTATKFADSFVIHYARRHLINPRDGGHFALDVVVPEFPATEVGADLPPRTRHMPEDEHLGAQDTRPMLIALHGLSGGSHETYLRAALHALLQKDPEWTACVVNARGCALSKITSRQLFNARWTSDIRAAIAYLHSAFPNRPLFAIGFSLGGNILTNYLGEEGEGCILKAAVVCSNPWQLELASKYLHRSWIGREVYSKVMGANLRGLFELHIDTLRQDPRIDVAKVRGGKYLYEFDRDLTATVFGYPTVGAYYRDASSVDNLLKVRVPVLVVHAGDDPIAPGEAIPFDEVGASVKYVGVTAVAKRELQVQANPYVFMAVTEGGGHLSWFEWGGGRWFGKPVSGHPGEGLVGGIDFACNKVCNFLTKFASDVVGVEMLRDSDEADYANGTAKPPVLEGTE
jgi:predicted alpha/beta-fold hydrolase